MKRILQFMVVLLAAVAPMGLSASARTQHRTTARGHVQESSRTQKKISHLQTHRRTASRGLASATTSRQTMGRGGHLRRASLSFRRHRSYERFTGNSFSDSTGEGDITAGEDPVVRQAAVDALGNMNGTVVAIDPTTGRILAMVNQKIALSSGAEPCSTIKVSVALAALQEGIVTKETPVNLGGSYHMNLTEALAHSNNLYFETLGRRLGFERVRHYANQFGLGELAGYNIPGEQLGIYPDRELTEKQGGVGRMCSFGEGVNMTPLQLGALVSSISNGGTLFYLQHPQSPEEVLNFQPKVKRTLDIARYIPEISDGMHAAVQYGTARSLRASFTEIPVLGKTGTCSNNGTRFGWFASSADTQYGRIVTVFFLEGGRATFGPKAAELTGHFYRNLYDRSYFTAKSSDVAPVDKPVAAAVTGVSQ